VKRLFLSLFLFAAIAWGQAVVVGPSIQNAPYSNNYLYFNKLHWAGNWAADQYYNSQDMVNLGSVGYVSLSPLNIGNSPDVSPAWWSVVLSGVLQITPITSTAQLPGTCTSAQMWLLMPAGTFYTCQNGVPGVAGSGGPTTVSWSALTSGQWAALTSSQWSTLTP
jgi:hypothetical protein